MKEYVKPLLLIAALVYVLGALLRVRKLTEAGMTAADAFADMSVWTWFSNKAPEGSFLTVSQLTEKLNAAANKALADKAAADKAAADKAAADAADNDGTNGGDD